MADLVTPDDVLAAEVALAERAPGEGVAEAILDAVVPALLARHLEELAAAHDATAARTDHRIAPGSKSTARVFARWLRRHAATLTPKAPAGTVAFARPANPAAPTVAELNAAVPFGTTERTI